MPKKPAVKKPAVRKPVAPRPGTVIWSGNGQPMVVPRKLMRQTRPKPTPMRKSTRDDDFSPLPLLGVTVGVLLCNALASARAPPPPSVDANQVLAFTVLAGLAAFVFTANEKESAPTPPATAPADPPARERKRDGLRRMFRLRRKGASAADAAPTETAQPAAAPADGAAASTPRSRFGRFRARFSTKRT